MFELDYLFRFRGWELWLWRLFRAPEIDDTPANSLTIFRAKMSLYIALPAYLVFAVTEELVFLKVAIATIILAGLLDGVDGAIAKRLKCESPSGRCLDPAADFTNSCVAFVVILSEHGFESSLAVPAFGVIALGLVIFLLRVASGVRTHFLARLSILSMYLGAVALFISIAAMHALLPEKITFWLLTGSSVVGHGLFPVGLVLMVISTVVYARRAWPKIHFHPRGMEQLS